MAIPGHTLPGADGSPAAPRGPSPLRQRLRPHSLTVYRLDFKATIKTPQGPKIVLIEIQKAKFATDIMRFRRYLGAQYQDKNDVHMLSRNVWTRRVYTGKISIPVYRPRMTGMMDGRYLMRLL